MAEQKRRKISYNQKIQEIVLILYKENAYRCFFLPPTEAQKMPVWHDPSDPPDHYRLDPYWVRQFLAKVGVTTKEQKDRIKEQKKKSRKNQMKVFIPKFSLPTGFKWVSRDRKGRKNY